MVHSIGTPLESQRFKIDLRASTKNSGFPQTFRSVSAGGEDAARRAMPNQAVRERAQETGAAFRPNLCSRPWFRAWVPDTGGHPLAESRMLLSPTALRSAY